MKGLTAWSMRWRRLAPEKLERDDADIFEMDSDGRSRCGLHGGRREFISRTADDPGRLDDSRRGIEILDDAQARGISRSRQDLQHRMDPVSGHRTHDAGAGGRRAR